MRPDVFIIVALAALGTWGLRYLPALLMRARPRPGWSRFLSAVGPAAIAALAVAAFLPELTPDLWTLLPMLAGSAAVIAAHLWRRDVAISTIAGAAAYGLVFAMMPM